MSLIGTCADCGESARLHFTPYGDESRPTVCARCKHHRKELAHDYRAERRHDPTPPHVGPYREEVGEGSE